MEGFLLSSPCRFGAGSLPTRSFITMTSLTTQPVHVLATPPADAVTRRNIRHLYGDIAGFGVLSGTAVAFLSIYATRLGATNLEVSILTAGPALVNLIVTLPAGQWIAGKRLVPVVFWSSLGQRIIYPLLVPIALLLAAPVQLPLILLMVALVSIPGTVLAIAFNALFAEAVPESRRGDVVGKRNALMALTMLVSLVLSGQILRLLPLEQGYLGYAIVFALGALGAAFSSYHLFRIRLAMPEALRPAGASALGKARAVVAPLRTPFGPFVFSLFVFHFAQYLPAALFTLFWVRVVKLSDAQISIINATFYTVMLVASLRLGPLTARYGNRRLVYTGAFLLSSYPLLTGLSRDLSLLLVAAVLGGAVWAVLGGALSNRILERIPTDDRPSHLALYNLALNGAILIGATTGASIGDLVGLRTALLVAAGLRMLAAALLWKLG